MATDFSRLKRSGFTRAIILRVSTRLIDSKWVLKKKRYGQFSSSILEQVYTIITRLEFTKNYSSVVSEITLCTILLIYLIYVVTAYVTVSRI